jgi:hypothetical protein
MLLLALKGFFDCVDVRFANTNFAQDDKAEAARIWQRTTVVL